MNIKELPKLTYSALLLEWAGLTDRLDSLYSEKGEVQKLQTSSRYNAFTNSSATSITQREWEAKLACQTETLELLTIEAEIASLLEVKELIRACLTVQAS